MDAAVSLMSLTIFGSGPQLRDGQRGAGLRQGDFYHKCHGSGRDEEVVNTCLMVFYSWAGHTKRMAKFIAAQTGEDMLEIIPQAPHSQNYTEVVKQARKEIQEGRLPEIQETACGWDSYDVIYVGTPVWSGTMAPPVVSFLHQHSWKGKRVMPFSTHVGGGKGHTDRDIAQLCAGAEIAAMYTGYEGGSEGGIAAWIQAHTQPI